MTPILPPPNKTQLQLLSEQIEACVNDPSDGHMTRLIVILGMNQNVGEGDWDGSIKLQHWNAAKDIASMISGLRGRIDDFRRHGGEVPAELMEHALLPHTEMLVHALPRGVRRHIDEAVNSLVDMAHQLREVNSATELLKATLECHNQEQLQVEAEDCVSDSVKLALG